MSEPQNVISPTEIQKIRKASTPMGRVLTYTLRARKGWKLWSGRSRPSRVPSWTATARALRSLGSETF